MKSYSAAISAITMIISDNYHSSMAAVQVLKLFSDLVSFASGQKAHRSMVFWLQTAITPLLLTAALTVWSAIRVAGQDMVCRSDISEFAALSCLYFGMQDFTNRCFPY